MSSHDHTVTLEFDGDLHPIATMKCTAPIEAACHARYDCDCESWSEDGIESGVPWHRFEPGDQPHFGHLDPLDCGFVTWFDASSDNLSGSVTFAVTPDWQGDYYLFEAVEHDRSTDLPLSAGTTRPSARPGFHEVFDGNRWVPICDVCGDEAAYCDGTRHHTPVVSR